MGDRSSEMGGGWRVAGSESRVTRNPQQATARLGFVAAIMMATALTTSSGWTQQLGTYAAGATTASSVAANATFGTLARGTGVNSATASGYYVSSNWDSTSRSGARTANEFHGFSVQSSTGFNATFTSFTFTAYRTASGPTIVGVGYSTDNGTTWVDSPDYSLASSSAVDVTFTWDFTDFTTSNSVIFRIYGWSASSTGNLRTKDVILNGTVASAGLLSSPSLSAATNVSVDSTFDITFVDDVSWRNAINSITVGGSALPSNAYTISSGKITFTPSNSSLLQSSGAKTIAVVATGYNNASVSQTINAGAANNLFVSTQPTAPASNGGTLAVQPIVTIRDQYNNTVTNSSASVVAAKGAGTWTLGGTTSVNASSGVATFQD